MRYFSRKFQEKWWHNLNWFCCTLKLNGRFENIKQTEITIIQNRLNNRPRKILKYYTPNEIFFKEVSRQMAV